MKELIRLATYVVLISLLGLSGCVSSKGKRPHDRRDRVTVPITNDYLTRVLYKEAYDQRKHLQFLIGVVEPPIAGKETLATALDAVKNLDNRRLLIPLSFNGRYVLIGIVQHSGTMFYLDPTAEPLPHSVSLVLQNFCKTYLKTKFKLERLACTVDDYSSAIGLQTDVNDDGTITLLNIRDLIRAAPVTNLHFNSAQITSVNNAMSMPSKAVIIEKARAQHDDDYANNVAFRAANPPHPADQATLFSTDGLSFAVFPYKVGRLTTLSRYDRTPAYVGAAFEAIGTLDDPIERDIIPSIQTPKDTSPDFTAYYASLPYQKFFEAMHAIDPQWATRPYNAQFGYKNPDYPEVGCAVGSANFKNKTKCLRRVSGFAFRGEGRDLADLKSAGEMAPPSLYAGSLRAAYNTLQSGGTNNWSKTWVRSKIYTNTGVASKNTSPGAELVDYAPVINIFTPLKRPDVVELKALFNADNTVPDGSWVTDDPSVSLLKSFYEYTILNPYIHGIIFRAKGFLSTTKSILVAKGFAAGQSLAPCGAHDTSSNEFQFNELYSGMPTAQASAQCMITHNGWTKVKYVYALFIDGGFDLSQPDSDPWAPSGSKKKSLFSIFHVQEIPIPGAVKTDKIVGYIETDPDNRGYFKNYFFLSDDLAYDDPGAFEKIYRAFDEGNGNGSG